MNIKPYGKRVLVKIPEITDNKSDSGIFLPKEMNTDVIRWGTVVAVSEDCTTVSTNTEICFGKHNGVELKPGYVVVKEEEILAWR